MKQSICFLVYLIFLFVLLSPASSSHFLSTSEVLKEEVKINGKVSLPYSLDQMETTDSLNKLMGLEECEDEDGECFKRRVLAEAHLDYIYTQHHNHP
ncbi:putative phytosulfokines 6 [Lycium barbarum]|uniref:putative phytosulfokines 6 n=1 Tax=Lycium barbarum TaxID=112863 RepID=UPI00293F5F99|nr:putative phytosulfokines 6 [Lycium barbarum]